mmetsp:Transcript_29827/g.84001  ORF Transcript_29827/g.84001 Transcript_29827/m.84001 type:complete len:205 (+) Transcript_29827:115-729(+)
MTRKSSFSKTLCSHVRMRSIAIFFIGVWLHSSLPPRRPLAAGGDQVRRRQAQQLHMLVRARRPPVAGAHDLCVHMDQQLLDAAAGQSKGEVAVVPPHLVDLDLQPEAERAAVEGLHLHREALVRCGHDLHRRRRPGRERRHAVQLPQTHDPQLHGRLPGRLLLLLEERRGPRRRAPTVARRCRHGGRGQVHPVRPAQVLAPVRP